MNKVLFSNITTEYGTPPELFNTLDDEFHFTLDAAANDDNHKCSRYYSIEQNSLLQSWKGETVFLNPPYGRDLTLWVAKASQEAANGATVVCLLPARTNVQWFHSYVLGKAEIRFLKGKVKFGEMKTGAPFGSMIVIFHPSH